MLHVKWCTNRNVFRVFWACILYIIVLTVNMYYTFNNAIKLGLPIYRFIRGIYVKWCHARTQLKLVILRITKQPVLFLLGFLNFSYVTCKMVH